nr:DNA-binding protein [uncultured Romboutsia sp.]
MKDKERIKKFIELQDKDFKFEDIALELGIAKTTLRVFLNKKGYKMHNGKYKPKDEGNEFKQIEFDQIENSNKNKFNSIKENKNTGNKLVKIKKEQDTKKKLDSKTNNNESNSRKNIKIDNKVETKKIKRGATKKDRKINITQNDLDKLCEVYDWYMEVKDLKSMKIKSKTNKKDIKIEDTDLDSLKSTTIKVDKKTWEDFERLCSNSEFSKQEIITQALKDFMKEYKNLL